MKKIIVCLLTIFILLQEASVFADLTFEYEELDAYTEPELFLAYDYPDAEVLDIIKKVCSYSSYVCTIDNEVYNVGRGDSSYSLPIKLTGEHIIGPDCIWTGQYYYRRSSDLDGYWYDASKYACPLSLYDENWNLVKKFELKDTFEQHALKIGYYNGTYYCLLRQDWNGDIVPERVIKSTDFENWEETTEDVPQAFENVTTWGNKISFNNIDFASVLYENEVDKEVFYTIGDCIIKIDENMDFYVTRDNVYFKKINYPEELRAIDKENNYNYKVKCVYELNDKVIIDLSRRVYGGKLENAVVRLSIDKEDFYSGVVEKEETAYVKMNGSYIGFAVPPVIEDDRTLVPMRFVFEQMGATVDWDEATESATATLNNSSVTFSIDNTTADVNNTAVTMDVPARLINDKTMVPLRFLSENLGLTVTWDEETRTATIE